MRQHCIVFREPFTLTDLFARQHILQIKLIDDSIGRMIAYLENAGLRRDTIVVFTSDHGMLTSLFVHLKYGILRLSCSSFSTAFLKCEGDMMDEHNRQNKGVPYKASAQVPMIIQWPGKIRKKRIVETAYSSVDFTPTILSLMGVNSGITYDGLDASTELLRRKMNTTDADQIRFMTDAKKKSWAAAFTNQYKLVLSRDEPWLFDLYEDPDELYNKYRDPEYAEIGEKLRTALLDAMADYNFVLKQKSYLPDAPLCWDSKDEIPGWDNRVCSDLELPNFKPACEWSFVNNTCPRACDACCEDSEGSVWLYGAMRSCGEMNDDERFCTQQPAIQFCPKSCGLCDQE
jgi:hypothetical protein